MDTKNRLILNTAAALALSALPDLVTAAPTETIVMAERARVAVMASDVAVDGKPRPDIAQALSDSITAGMLRKGDYRVFQMEPSSPRLKPKKKDGPMLGSTTATSSRAPTDLDFIIAFNLVGEESKYRMTVKKIRNSDNEVMEVHELTSQGKLDQVFGMVPAVLQKLQTKIKPTVPVVRTRAPARIQSQLVAAPTPSSEPVSSNANYWTTSTGESLPPELAGIDFTKIPKALIYQRLGHIQAINDTWKFCVISPATTAPRIDLHDSLHVLYDEDGRIYADLRVANFDHGRVIADFGNQTPAHRKLFPGDEVFGWAPPAR